MDDFVKNSHNYFEIAGYSAENYKIGVSARACSSGFTGSAGPVESKARDREILREITGFPGERIIMLDQVHGDEILTVDSVPETESEVYGSGDGLITSLKNVVLVIRTADCVPVIIADEKNRVLGAVHSGWRSTRENITGKCIEKMKSLYSSDPGKLKVFILPSIGPAQYEVSEDVAVFFPEDRLERDGKIYVDLWSNIERSASEAGVKPENIVNFRICNRTEHEEFFSHRYGDIGRNLNFAYMC